MYLRASTLTTAIALVVLLSVFARPTAYAQDQPSVRLRPKKSRAARDRNIGSPKPPPGKKGGPVCTISLLNATNHPVGLWVNNREETRYSRAERIEARVETGRLKIYARTNRINRQFLYWGPTYQRCGSSTTNGKLQLKIQPDLRM